MKRASTLAVLMILPALVFGQSWIARYNGTGNSTDEASALAVDGAGNVYVTGTSLGSAGNTDYATVKYNAAGIEQWARRYNGPANQYDIAAALVFDGTYVYVTGGSMDANLYSDVVTIKYNASGDTQWVRRYVGPAGYDDQALAVAVDRSGNVYAAGYVSGATTGWDFLLVKYSSSGVEQWARTYVTNDQDYIVGMVIDGSGNVCVTGSSGDPYFMTWDYVTIKYSPAGDTLWLRRYNGPADGHDEARGIALDANGNVCVTGASVGTGSSWDFTTIKYNSAGVEQWVQRYNGPANLGDWANAVAADPAGNILVTGNSAASGTNVDYATVKYNPAGVEQWARRYNGPAGAYDDALAIAVDANGNAYVAGQSDPVNLSADYLTVKYNPAGDTLWTKRYNGPASGADVPHAVAVDGSGYVYLTGESMGAGSDFDYATIKYPGVSVQEAPAASIVRDHLVLRASPNPFRDRVTITLDGADQPIRRSARARSGYQQPDLRIYDASGRVVRSFPITNNHLPITIRWDGRDDLGAPVPPGVYFVQLSASGRCATQKLIRDAK